jgi:formamidopyrimidine-DNA glycosylase
MAEALPGRRIERVYREGKHIVFDLGATEDGAAGSMKAVDRVAKTDMQWVVHLGMTGRLLVSAADVPVPDHTHAALVLGDGRELRFVDARRFGRLALVSGSSFRGPGREPLTISPGDFVDLFRDRKLPIKAALLNQKLLHGVGNIYADESLFRAGIRPTAIAGRLSRERLLRLREVLRKVLRKAIELGGSSVSDYVDADGVAGFFQLEHKVYMRTGEPCLECGRPIQRIVLAGRGTHYCARCQR